jgi:hypothetical protein
MRTWVFDRRRVVAWSAAVAWAVAGLGLTAPGSAVASGGSPQWTVTAVSRPTNFAPGNETGEDSYVATITNTGSAASDGSPVRITAELGAGISLDPAGGTVLNELSNAKVRCVLLQCTYTGVVGVDEALLVSLPVDVSAGASGVVTSAVRVAGGGAPDAAMQTPTTISGEHASFGVSPGGATTTLSSVQAGSHPDLTTSVAFNTINAIGSLAGDPKTTIDDLPAGFGGADLVDTPSCAAADFLERRCAIGTQVGVTTVTVDGIESGAFIEPVYNLTPDPGEAAKLGFQVTSNVIVEGGVYLRSDEGPRAVFENIEGFISELDNVSLTLWGVPADPIHDPLRWNPVPGNEHFGVSSDAPRVPFFTNPTSCGTPLVATITTASWQDPGDESQTQMPFGSIVGCDRLTMAPSLTVEATTDEASSATGLDVVTHVPQTYDNPEGLATPHLRKVVVTLPEGMTVNPSAGAGLGACTAAEVAEESAVEVPGKGCPNDSKLGSIKAQSPALREEATGSVFLATPYQNPFGSLLALYIVARIPNRGIIVKTAGEVHADPVTGQLVTTFDTTNLQTPHDGLPQVPISTLTFAFRQGSTSPLVTPPACGLYTAQAQVTTWSDPLGAPLTPAVPPFPITSGFGGAPCPSGGTPPFSPQVAAGTVNSRAGSYSPLDIHITRSDGEQEITRFSAQMPPGLSANLSGVPFCPDAQIALAKQKTGAQEEVEPSCPAASQIGHTLVGAGVGATLVWTPGRVYLAGPYNGAPFSIVAITSAKVGPFDLGTVVVREALKIDPVTADVSVDAAASDPIPHIIDGIVIHVRDIRVYIDRPAFTLNPTSCERMSLQATVNGSGANFASSADDVPVTVTDPFQVADCGALSFKPTFQASTTGKSSRANGAGLTVKLAYPQLPLGSQANIKSVKVELPLALPSRLSTLQKACPDATFNANPAGCPAASVVGHASAITPILPVPLAGPAYFVSHGGAKFPELIVVLQGYGVTIELHGETFISKKGITSSTFSAVPDQPVSSFELTLPQGPYSALAANGDLCQAKLVMPTRFTAQNGVTLQQNTQIHPTGCPEQVTITRHRVRGHTLTLTVAVSGAGTLKAAGKGLVTVTRHATTSGTLMLSLKEHGSGKLESRVLVSFTPSTGGQRKKLNRSLRVSFH